MERNETKNLIIRAKKYDTEAFTELIQLYIKDMYKVALAILMNDEDASDAIQDTILACWEKISTLKENDFFKTWMIRILINKCYDIRKKSSQIIYIDEEKVDVSAADSFCNLELKEALSLLDEKYRSVMILFYGEGYHIDEIASILKVPLNTVKTRLRRGREKLAAYYEISEGSK